MSRTLLQDIAVALGVAVVVTTVVLWTWPGAMNAGRLPSWTPLVSVLGAGLWGLAAVLDRTRPALARLATAALVGAALASVSIATPRTVGRVLSGDHVRAWNVFHYHLGSKYFDELGYTELYAAVLAADDAWQAHKAALPPDARAEADAIRDFRFIHETRDMRSYVRVSRAEAVSGLQADLSPERLAELGADSRALRPWMNRSTWSEVFTDFGYNPAPPWTALGMPLARLVSVDGAGVWVLANSDLPLWILMIAALWWAFGPRVAAAAVLFLVTVPFNAGRWTGGLLQYDWLAAAVIGMACWRKGYAATAGALLSWAAMTRIFPGLMLLPPVGAALWWLARRGRPAPVRLLRLTGTFTACCAVLLVASHTTGRGRHTWPDWVDNISLHTLHHPHTSARRIGLKRLTVHSPSPERFWDHFGTSTQSRIERAAAVAPPLQLLSLALLLPALVRRERTDAMLLMLFAAFILTVASRYYASIWILLLTLQLPEPDEPHRAQGLTGVFAGVVLLGMPAAMALPMPDDQGSYFLVNYVAWAMFAVVCVMFLVEDYRTRRAYSSSADNTATAASAE